MKPVTTFLLLALVVGCRSTPDNPPVEIGTESGALPLALRAIDGIDDSERLVETLNVIARGLSRSGFVEDAVAVAVDAGRRIDDLPMSDGLVELQLETARILLGLGEVDRAVQLIGETTTFVASARNETVQSEFLPRIARAALEGADDTRDLLPAIVDPVYVMEDPGLRAVTFMSVIDAYSSAGLGQSVQGLLQQSIPAIRTVQTAAERARLFGELSVRARELGQSELSGSLSSLARDELAQSESPSKEAVRSVFRAVSADRGSTQAAELLTGNLDPAGIVNALLAIAQTAAPGEESITVLREAVDATPAIADEMEKVVLYAEIAEQFTAAGLRLDSIVAARAAYDLLSGSGNSSRHLPALLAVCRIFARLGISSQITVLIESTPDPYGRVLMAMAAAEVFVEVGQPGVADDFGVIALEAAEVSELFADELRIRIADGFASTGSYGLAVGTIDRMESMGARVRATARIGHRADPDGLSPSQVERLTAALGL